MTQEKLPHRKELCLQSEACPVVSGHALIISLEIQVSEAVGLLGFTSLFRLSDSLLTSATQILIHGAITGSGMISSAVKPPGQSGTAVGKMIVFNKCS